MRHPLLISLLTAIVVMTVGCGSLPGQQGHIAQPTATSPAASTSPVTATPKAEPTTTPAPAPTKRPTPGTSPTTIPSPPGAGTSDEEAAVQTLLDYFDAINQQDYGRAYGYWAGKGVASGQTPQGFASGYASTVRVTVLLGTVGSQGKNSVSRVSVQVALISIVNQTNYTQQVHHYQGTYTLQPGEGSSWEIASASIAEVAAGPHAPADVADPTTLLRSYFDAINRREFARAYTYWDNLGQASRQTFAQFEQGYATTRQVTVHLGTPQENAGAGNVYADVPVTIVATQSDGSTRTYSGTYTTHRANVPPFDQLGWRIEGAKVTLAAGGSTR